MSILQLHKYNYTRLSLSSQINHTAEERETHSIFQFSTKQNINRRILSLDHTAEERENSCSASVVEAGDNYVFFPISDMLELDFGRLATSLRAVESTILDLGDEVHKFYVWIWSGGNLGLRLLYYIMHLIVSIWYFVLDLINAFESFLISSGFLDQYKKLDVSRVKYLAVVIDSEEALHTLKVLELLRWLAAIGLKHVCLYDPEGVLKRSKDALALWLKSERMSNGSTRDPLLEQKYLSLEVISFTDGKHAVAKAANILLKKHYLSSNSEKPELMESDMTDALGELGYKAPEPDLMLIYGPTRCHLGFPAWRIRYTEMAHMGPLKNMRFGSLVKAIHRYTLVHQNYGT